MIGTRLRGFHHLFRLAKKTGELRLFFKSGSDSCVSYGVALYVSNDICRNPYAHNNGDYVLIFNDSASNVRMENSHFRGTSIDARINSLRSLFPHVWMLSTEKKNFTEDSCLLKNKIALPSDFENKYAEFCIANKRQMQPIEKYININSAFAKYLFSITNGSKNFFLWAAYSYFKQGISLHIIEKILIWNENYSQLAKNLKKGTITGYTSGRDFFDIIREMAILRRNKRANDVINMFNTSQKKALRELALNDRTYNTLSRFAKLSGRKKINFIKKMSTVSDPNEIIKQMSFLADVHFEWSKESLMDFLKNGDNFNCEVVLEKGDTILLKVNDYETVKRLAKTTNWCISKDKKYWNEYVANRPMATQYVLMDFSRKEDDNLSIIGFTSVHDRGITNAHDFQNKNIMGKNYSTNTHIKSFLSSYISKFITSGNIYDILDRNGIRLSDVVSYEPSPYEWNRENAFAYLESCVDDDDYYIIYDDGNRVVLVADSSDITYFIGDKCAENFRNSKYEDAFTQYVVFIDFTKKANDPNKLMFACVSHDLSEHESSASCLRNERCEGVDKTFDSILKEYGLPYDIICRTDDPVERFYNALRYYDLATLGELIKNTEVVNTLKQRERNGYVSDTVSNSIFAHTSSDIINLFYDNGMTMAQVCGARRFGNIIARLINNMFENANSGESKFADMHVPSEDEIKAFKDDKIDNYIDAYYIGNFMLLKSILEHENNREFLEFITEFVYGKHSFNGLLEFVAAFICEKLDMSHATSSIKRLLGFAYGYDSNTIKGILSSKENIGDDVKKLIGQWTNRDAIHTSYTVSGLNCTNTVTSGTWATTATFDNG